LFNYAEGVEEKNLDHPAPGWLMVEIAGFVCFIEPWLALKQPLVW
jgi:hypothetical protein